MSGVKVSSFYVFRQEFYLVFSWWKIDQTQSDLTELLSNTIVFIVFKKTLPCGDYVVLLLV
jgi:hypothetical protein